MCFSFLVLWGRAIVTLAGNFTASVSNLRFSLNWLVLVAGMRVAALAWWLFIALKL
jgi:hypothetical protein